MSSISTPQILFRGGPLDGKQVLKDQTGRWPGYLNDRGHTLNVRVVQGMKNRGVTTWYAKTDDVSYDENGRMTMIYIHGSAL